MEQQKITVKIAGRPYVLNASSEEHERKIRISADEIVKMIIDELNGNTKAPEAADISEDKKRKVFGRK